MNPTTEPTQTRELVLLRLEQSFTDFLGSLLPAATWQAVPYWILGTLAAALTVAWAVRAVVRLTSHDPRWHTRPGPLGRQLWRACVASWVAFGAWFLLVFFLNDTFARQGGYGGEVAGDRATNTVLWFTFVGAVLTAGAVFTVAMYVKDSRTARWYWASFLALVRVGVYAILCVVFLLPAYQTKERTEKRSRVVVLLDVSPSVTRVSDEIGAAPGKKLKSRLTTVAEFLSDEKVAFLKNLLDKNPVVVYRFGSRLDEDPQTFAPDDATWAAAEWEAFATYDFKPFLLRGLTPAGAEAVRNSQPWGGDAPGTADWAGVWFARPEDDVVPQNMPDEDKERLKDNRKKLEKRIDVARSIAQGTSVPESVLAAVNREAANMAQGVMVFSDGRSKAGTDSAYAELARRAKFNGVPVFTVAVGEDRQTVSIVVTDVQAPDNAPPDEPFKIVVEADGVNLANTDAEVSLDLFLPGKDPKADPADHTLTGRLTFLPGDPPHGQAEFVVDPAKLPEKMTEESKDAAIKKRVLKEGPWAARARIPKNRQEAYPEPEHVRDRPGIQVIKKPLRVLLVASGPSREYLQLKTLLVREVQDSRAELCVLLQNEAGEKGTAVQDVPPERLLNRFPTRLDTTGDKKADPKERFYNLNEYDLIIAFDPDWSELSQDQAEALRRWAQEQGGGFIYVAGPLHTPQLARVEPNSRLSPLLDLLPVVPEDLVAIKAGGTPRTPRRLYFHPLEGSDLLKLEEGGDGPTAGWEKFFTDRDKYAATADLKAELFPRRGFYSSYPVKKVEETRPGSRVLAELATLNDGGEVERRPWLTTNNPSAAWRTCFMGSGEVYRLLAYDPQLGKDYFQRFWVQLTKYMAAKRNVKAARGRVLLSKEYAAGSPVRVQARLLDPGSKPYAEGALDPKFRVVRMSADGQQEREFGPFPLAAKKGAGGFDGYYQGQVSPDPKEMPAGDKRYRVVIDVPDSAGETIEGEYMLRKSDPEMDNTRPDYPALLGMASEFDKDLTARIKKPDVVEALSSRLPREAGVPKLAFRLGDPETLKLIPDCMDRREVNVENRGKAEDLWDQGLTVPEAWTPAGWKVPQQVSYVLLAVVGLLCVEWMTRKLLRLA